jgi:hypothetical protein
VKVDGSYGACGGGSVGVGFVGAAGSACLAFSQSHAAIVITVAHGQGRILGATYGGGIMISDGESKALVAVLRVRGLGHLAIQYANIEGGRVVAVGMIDERV